MKKKTKIILWLMPLWSLLMAFFSQLPIRKEVCESDDPFFIIAFLLPVIAGIIAIKKKEKKIGYFCLSWGVFFGLTSMLLPLLCNVPGPRRKPKEGRKTYNKSLHRTAEPLCDLENKEKQ
jgi:hypothetical protein